MQKTSVLVLFSLSEPWSAKFMSALCVWQLQNYKKLCHLKKIIKERYCIRLTIYVIYQNVMLFGETDSKQASKRRLKIKSMLIISAGAYYELE